MSSATHHFRKSASPLAACGFQRLYATLCNSVLLRNERARARARPRKNHMSKPPASSSLALSPSLALCSCLFTLIVFSACSFFFVLSFSLFHGANASGRRMSRTPGKLDASHGTRKPRRSSTKVRRSLFPPGGSATPACCCVPESRVAQGLAVLGLKGLQHELAQPERNRVTSTQRIPFPAAARQGFPSRRAVVSRLGSRVHCTVWPPVLGGVHAALRVHRGVAEAVLCVGSKPKPIPRSLGTAIFV